MKILILQISNVLLSKEYKLVNYMEQVHNNYKQLGYSTNKHYLEEPTWINNIKAICEANGASLDIYYVEDIIKTIDIINISSNMNYILISPVNITVKYFNIIFKAYRGNAKIIAGGCFDRSKLMYATTVNTIKDFAIIANLKYTKDEYSSFSGDEQCIPRIGLSTGCNNNCTMCTIDKPAIDKSLTDITNELVKLENKNFKLIYLDDKTLGQVYTIHNLKHIHWIIKNNYDIFTGFIGQTTVDIAKLKSMMFLFKDSGIKILEIGLESTNRKALEYINKSHNVDDFIEVLELALEYNILIIPNIIIGIPGESEESYSITLNILNLYKKIILFYNLNCLAIYENSILSKRIKIKDNNDNEYCVNKSFRTNKEKEIDKIYLDKFINQSLKNMI